MAGERAAAFMLKQYGIDSWRDRYLFNIESPGDFPRDYEIVPGMYRPYRLCESLSDLPMPVNRRLASETDGFS
jgi:hypothetical protein